MAFVMTMVCSNNQFVDGYQVELPDDWLKSGNVWEVRRESESVNVHFGGNVYMKQMPDGSLKPVAENERILKAVPYDTGVVGYENDTVNTLRLWSVEIPALKKENIVVLKNDAWLKINCCIISR